MSERMRTGRRGERAAEAHLVRRGWTVLDRRWRGGGAEIDLIAARRDRVVAFEVKTRADPGALAEPVAAAQRERIARALEGYVARRPDLRGRALGVDLLAVHRRPLGHRVRHVRDVVG